MQSVKFLHCRSDPRSNRLTYTTITFPLRSSLCPILRILKLLYKWTVLKLDVTRTFHISKSVPQAPCYYHTWPFSPAFYLPASKLGFPLKLLFCYQTLGQVYVLSLIGSSVAPLLLLLLLALRPFFLSSCKMSASFFPLEALFTSFTALLFPLKMKSKS